MAGIGFKLRRMVSEEGLSGFVFGYLSSAVLAAGPWLISIATMAVMAHAMSGQALLLSSLVVTINMLTLGLAGPFQFALTRYLSDRLYAADIERHVPAFLTSWLLGVVPFCLVFAILMALTPLGWAWRLQALSLFTITSSMWMLLLFLGVVRAYRAIILGFFLGNAVSLLASFGLGRTFSDPQLGMLTGYTLGQALVVAVLAWVLVSEFPMSRLVWDQQAVRALTRYPALTAAGGLYYLGLWADKALMRFTDQAETVAGVFWLRTEASYEQSAFLAQLTVLPGLALFFMAVETEFFERFREFFAAISQGRTMSRIQESKARMLECLKAGASRLVGVQGVVSLVAILLAPHWMPVELVPLGRTQMVGVYFQSLLYFSTVVLLYFELYQSALWGVTVFCAGNFVLTAVWQGSGWGFVAATLAGLLVNCVELARALPQIDRLVFVRQPLVLTHPQRWAQGVGVYTRGGPS